MVSIEELKLGNETLEALNFLLSQISDLEKAVSAISMSEIKDANTLTKEQIATLKDVKSVVESIKEELGSKKSDFDKKKEKFDIDFSTFSSDKLDFDSKNSVALRNFNEIIATANEIREAKGSAQSASEKSTQNLNEAREILERLRVIASTIQELTNKTKSDVAALNLDELTALKGSLIELKNALEVIREAGIINDDEISLNKTYSSQKLDTLLNKKLDVSQKEAMFSDGKIKAEMLPDINATRLGGKEAGEFSLKSENEKKMLELDNKVWEAENSLSDKMLVLETKVDTKLDKSLVGVANGVAKLDSKAKILSEYIPDEYMSINKVREEITENITIQNVSLMEDIGRTYIRKDSIAHVLGGSDSLVMSQKGVSEALNSKSGGVIMLENENSLITTTAIGAQFYCKSNSGLYVLINNSELTKESKFSEAVSKGKIVKIDKGIGEPTWLKNDSPSNAKVFFGYKNIYNSNTSIIFPSSFSSHYTIILSGGAWYDDKKKGHIFGVYSYSPNSSVPGTDIGDAISSNVSASFSLSGVIFSLSNDADIKLTYFVFGY